MADRPKVVRDKQAMRRMSRKWRMQGLKVGFVPTMGYLHEGHMALVRKARGLCDRLVVSIFVNPTQFGPSEDLDRYPRDLNRDLDLCASEGVDAVYHPSAEEMYPDGYQTYVQVEELSKPLCGASRPTHFRGVATVCTKLFNVVEPDLAVFGEKDFQQLQVIRRMVKDLDMAVEIVGHPIVREHDGLAMSSRNVYLSKEERSQALCLSKALAAAADLFESGERDAGKLVGAAKEEIAAAPLARIDYVELRDAETLELVSQVERPAVLALAVFFGKTRLIDNRVLSP